MRVRLNPLVKMIHRVFHFSSLFTSCKPNMNEFEARNTGHLIIRVCDVIIKPVICCVPFPFSVVKECASKAEAKRMSDLYSKERKSSWKSWRNERNSWEKMTKRTKPKKEYFQRNDFWQGQFSKNNDETNEIDGFLLWLNFFHVLPPLNKICWTSNFNDKTNDNETKKNNILNETSFNKANFRKIMTKPTKSMGF